MEPSASDRPERGTPEFEPDPALEDQAPPPEGGKSSDSSGEFVRIKRTHLYSALVPVAFVTGLALGFLFWGRDQGATAGSAAADESVGQEPVRIDVSPDDDPSIGPETAPITIIEFSDFNCPYCKRWQTNTFFPLLDAYPDQIRFVYRDFPVTSQESFIAAQAANCAGEQGDYWRFHDALLTGDLGLGRAAYSQYAESLGIDAQALLACVDSGRYADEVEADARYAASLGVSGTPTFFINGIPMVGAQPLAQFAQVIEGELH